MQSKGWGPLPVACSGASLFGELSDAGPLGSPNGSRQLWKRTRVMAWASRRSLLHCACARGRDRRAPAAKPRRWRFDLAGAARQAQTGAAEGASPCRQAEENRQLSRRNASRPANASRFLGGNRMRQGMYRPTYIEAYGIQETESLRDIGACYNAARPCPVRSKGLSGLDWPRIRHPLYWASGGIKL